jgi:hypothetical protein
MIDPTPTQLADITTGLDLLPMLLQQAILNEAYVMQIGGSESLRC